ncbi:protein MON2 homolog isoform X2 [Strongylocentrotus purpuratus]|uniref:Protein MON2 homolog n=1 Tax=Strongylocentrotus purpuratus TaxID=7668 RepID=A0A7M7N3B6_STRPU|nr:protein MON2 homolog isoform X2 [Strongylocentrotus purpuratus]
MTSDSAIAKRLVDNLQTDLRALFNETKRKYPPVKEAAEADILKIRTIVARSKDVIPALVMNSGEILQPFLLGCDTKNLRIVQLCLGSVQRLITHEALSAQAAGNVISMLWGLMECGMEDLKVLQTTLVILTTNTIVRGPSLAKAVVVCFRLHFSKDNTTSNTASAIVQQVISIVFERVLAEDEANADGSEVAVDEEQLKISLGNREAPKSLRPCAKDAYMLFQDLCNLVNGDPPCWLQGMTTMTKKFGLELLESVLNSFPQVFLRHTEFSFLLKERVCPLLIKLFSPSLKHRQGMSAPSAPVNPPEKPTFHMSLRLLRVVSVVINKYYSLLMTECEIFLSLLVKFMEGDKPLWQRVMALEVLHKICSQSKLLRMFCQSYDMKPHSTKIFANIVNALGVFTQSLFINPITERQNSNSSDKSTKETGSTSQSSTGSSPAASIHPQAAFTYKGVWIPLIPVATLGTSKALIMDMLEKTDAPPIPDGYAMSVSFACLLDVTKSVSSVVTLELESEEKRVDREERERKRKEQGSVLAEEEEREEEEEDDDRPRSVDSVLATVNTDLKDLWVEMVNSSWCGVLAALSLLLDACTDEAATEAILKCLELYASLCGKLGLTVNRDAFVTALCKSSLPPHYALAVLNIALPTSSNTSTPKDHKRSSSSASRDGFLQATEGGNADPADTRNQVVAVGTPLTSVVGGQQGPVMLTAKNIQCMRAILSLAHCHGAILGASWHLILSTLQHLVWILGLKPTPGGGLKADESQTVVMKIGGGTDSHTTVITTAAMTELPVLSSMLSQLFESSKYLDDVALHHLISALCKLSSEAMELAYSNRQEPSLFAVAKLLETGLVNLPRMEVLWRPLTAHLSDICQHPNVKMREWGAEAVTSLIKAALAYKHTPPLHENLRLQMLLLSPLQELSLIPHADIRQKQLDCVHQILSNNGETLVHGWPLVLGVVGAVTTDQGESLIRSAFQSIQLVVTDFLSIMPCYCLQICVEVAAKFGLQKEELNISLTAIGLLWNISDYLYQNREKIRTVLSKETVGGPKPTSNGEQPIPPFDALWLTLYSRLADLCVDSRPAVRKSGGQTLFSTISAHGALLKHTTWQIVLWHVLFPLLDKVKKCSSVAATEQLEPSGNILIHHSRDTAEKQWAETKVLTLAGVARVFNTWRYALLPLGDFPRAWALLLEHIEASALSPSKEVSLNALKSFLEVIQMKTPKQIVTVIPDPQQSPQKSGRNGSIETASLTTDLPTPGGETIIRMQPSNSDTYETENERTSDATNGSMEAVEGIVPGFEDAALWSNAWRVWISIGTNSTKPPETKADAVLPTQAFLTALVQIFPYLFDHVKDKFVSSDLQKLCLVLQSAVSVPVQADMSVFLIPSSTETEITTLQSAVLHVFEVLKKAVAEGSEVMQSMYPAIFDQLLTFITYSCQPPSFGHIETKAITKTAPKQKKTQEKWESYRSATQSDWVAMNYVPFAEKALQLTSDLYRSTAEHPSVMKQHVLQNILRVFQLPLGLKYACPAPSTWKLAVQCLLDILHVGLPVARKTEFSAKFEDMWMDLAASLELFLFSEHPTPSTLSVEEQQKDEGMDVKVVLLIREEILPFSSSVPEHFTARIMALLNRGSIHSASTASFLDVDNRQLREEFAKACFETLLQFSFISQTKPLRDATDEGALTKMALASLLQRCQEVLKKYVEDERLSGKCPLPRSRMTEMSFVLQAVTTLMQSLKKATADNVDQSTWSQVIGLYPFLVDCTTCTSSQVCKALKEALYQFQELLVAPHPPTGMVNGK